MPGSSSNRWGSPMWIPSKGCRPLFPSNRKAPATIPARPLGRSRNYDYLRLLYARVGHPVLFSMWPEITAQTVQQMVDAICELPEGSSFRSSRPSFVAGKANIEKNYWRCGRPGMSGRESTARSLISATTSSSTSQKKHNIEIVVDRLVMKPGDALMRRIADSVETSVKLAGDWSGCSRSRAKCTSIVTNWRVSELWYSLSRITPRVFSFNSPHGACLAAMALGGYAMAPGASEDEDFTLLERCERCHGARLKPESLAVKIAKRSIASDRAVGAGGGGFLPDSRSPNANW